MFAKKVIHILLILCPLLLIGCGQKGPLELPPEQPQENSPAPTPEQLAHLTQRPVAEAE